MDTVDNLIEHNVETSTDDLDLMKAVAQAVTCSKKQLTNNCNSEKKLHSFSAFSNIYYLP